jgi:outer membrane receptor for Fe3+-dicitrate
MDGVSVVAGHTGPGRSNGYGGAIIYEKQDNTRHKYSLLETGQTIGADGLHLQNYRLRGATSQLKNTATKYDISYEALQTDGWRDHNETSRGNLFAHVEQRLADRSTLDFYLVNTNLRGEIPSSLSLEDFETRPESAAAFWQNADGNEDYRRTIAGLTYTKSSVIGTIKLTPYMTRFVSDELRPFNRELQNNTTYGLRAQLERRLWSKGSQSVNLLTGYDLQHDDVDIRQISNQGEISTLDIDHQTNQSAYLSGSYLSSDWTITAGIDVTGLKTDDADYDPLYISPSLEARYRVNRQWSAYTRAGRGYNQPTLDLLLVNTVEASQADEVTIGLDYKETIGKTSIEWTAAAYRMWTDRELTTVLLDEESIVINGPASTITGLDLSGSVVTPIGRSTLSVMGSYTLLKTEVTEEEEATLIGKAWTAVPQHQGYLNTTYTIGGVSLSARASHFSSMYIDTRNTLSSDSYTILRSRLSYHHPKRLLNDRLTLQGMVEIDNLTDINYSSMVLPTTGSISPTGRYYYPGQPRNLLVQVKVGYYLW